MKTIEIEELEECERIAKIIDPDNTFLDECEELIKWRFGDENNRN